MLKVPTLYGDNLEEKQKEIKAYFQMCFKRYESLFDLVTYPLRHSIVFYYGDIATFLSINLNFLKSSINV